MSILPTVSCVDLNRYIGRWYEIASYPNRFEEKCASDITADYALLADGKIQVVNTCRQSSGKLRQSRGYAKIADSSSNAKLKVTFFWPFFGNYWIVDLDPDYRYAVVSEPRRKYLWILSRTPRLAPDQHQRLLDRIRQLGFDPSRLITPDQSAG